MKKLFTILIVSMFMLSGAGFAQEEFLEEPQIPVRPLVIPTIFSNKENACSIEEPCDNVQEEAQEEVQEVKKAAKAKKEKVKKEKVKKEKVKKEKVKKEKSEKKLDPLSIFKLDWDTSAPRTKVDVEKFLNLTDNQINAAKQNRLSGEEQIKPYMDEIKIREKKIKNIEFQNAPSDARDKQVERYYREIKEINKEADKIRKENQENFEKLLTPEQLELFKQIINQQKVSEEGNL